MYTYTHTRRELYSTQETTLGLSIYSITQHCTAVYRIYRQSTYSRTLIANISQDSFSISFCRLKPYLQPKLLERSPIPLHSIGPGGLKFSHVWPAGAQHLGKSRFDHFRRCWLSTVVYWQQYQCKMREQAEGPCMAGCHSIPNAPNCLGPTGVPGVGNFVL